MAPTAAPKLVEDRSACADVPTTPVFRSIALLAAMPPVVPTALPAGLLAPLVAEVAPAAPVPDTPLVPRGLELVPLP
jgi:hypothetical protein